MFLLAGIALIAAAVSTLIWYRAAAGSVAPADLAARLDRGECLPILDVRSEAEYAAGHLPGAVNVPFTQVSGRLDDLPGTFNEELFVYCGHGPRAYIAVAAIRRVSRRPITYVEGHFTRWHRLGFRLER